MAKKIGPIRRKFLQALGFVLLKIIPPFSPALATKCAVYIYGSMGMRFVGRPNYLSSRINFDGGGYSHIEIHEGVTISSYVRVLTHDWALYTVSKAFGYFSEAPIGRHDAISIGPYSFIGTGCIIMPGTKIGRGCLIGAGTVVRGTIPDHSIVIGSPGKIAGSTRDYVRRGFAHLGIDGAEISLD